MTSRANIRFEGLIGLYAPYFHWSVEARPDTGLFARLLGGLFAGGHESAGEGPDNQGNCGDSSCHHKDIVGAPSPKFPIRVESHDIHYRS